MYFANVISWTHALGRGDHSSSDAVKEKAQERDSCEDHRAWLAQGHHVELLPAVPGQKLSLWFGGRKAALTGDGHRSLRTGEYFAFAGVEKATE